MEQLGTTPLFSSAYHPQTDGNTERVNRVMEDMLRHFVHADQTNWGTLLPLVEFAINNAYHTSVNTTPFMLNYGRARVLPAWLTLARHERGDERVLPAVHGLMNTVQDAISRAKLCLEAARQRQKAYADAHRRDVTFNVGQEVLLSTKNLSIKMTGTAKLLPKYIGPLTIKKQVNPVAFQLNLPECMKVFHDLVLGGAEVSCYIVSGWTWPLLTCGYVP